MYVCTCVCWYELACGVSDGAVKRKACKNCTCGLAEQLDAENSEQQPPASTSSCGNVILSKVVCTCKIKLSIRFGKMKQKNAAQTCSIISIIFYCTLYSSLYDILQLNILFEDMFQPSLFPLPDVNIQHLSFYLCSF